MKPEDIESLISRYLHGTASAEQVAALSAAIETDPDFRRLYLHHARVHAALATMKQAEHLRPHPSPCSTDSQEPGA
jgi:hypothetical protein